MCDVFRGISESSVMNRVENSPLAERSKGSCRRSGLSDPDNIPVTLKRLSIFFIKNGSVL